MSAPEPVSAREPAASPVDCFRCVITVESPTHSPPPPSAHSPPSSAAHSPGSPPAHSPPSSPPLHQNGEPDEKNGLAGGGRIHANGAILAGGGKADAVSVAGVCSGAAGAGETKRRPPLTRGISRNKSDTNILPVILFACNIPRYIPHQDFLPLFLLSPFFPPFSSFFHYFFLLFSCFSYFFCSPPSPSFFLNFASILDICPASEPRPFCSRFGSYFDNYCTVSIVANDLFNCFPKLHLRILTEGRLTKMFLLFGRFSFVTTSHQKSAKIESVFKVALKMCPWP
jgi:hypothetical protein